MAICATPRLLPGISVQGRRKSNAFVRGKPVGNFHHDRSYRWRMRPNPHVQPTRIDVCGYPSDPFGHVVRRNMYIVAALIKTAPRQLPAWDFRLAGTSSGQTPCGGFHVLFPVRNRSIRAGAACVLLQRTRAKYRPTRGDGARDSSPPPLLHSRQPRRARPPAMRLPVQRADSRQ